MREVYRAIYTALESCLYLIGSLIANPEQWIYQQLNDIEVSL
ncbi:MAG: hypothetical protein RBR51_05650 [Candidatus Cloacimonadaceae bacterium]|nr:hypothetical protein [Candidatus Cloacimonadaceae bacterium]